MIGGEQVADLEGRRALVYVGGSIAAVKAGEVITLLRRRGAETRVAMTPSATRFITPLSLQSLSGHPVVSDHGSDLVCDTLNRSSAPRGTGGGHRENDGGGSWRVGTDRGALPRG